MSFSTGCRSWLMLPWERTSRSPVLSATATEMLSCRHPVPRGEPVYYCASRSARPVRPTFHLPAGRRLCHRLVFSHSGIASGSPEALLAALLGPVSEQPAMSDPLAH